MRSRVRSASRVVPLATASLLAYGWRQEARADGSGVDPSYGRIEGDVTIVVAAGGVLASGGPRAEGEVRVRYLETAGLFASYEDGPIAGSSADPRRVLDAGFELRPLFLFRWLRGLETHEARFDLAVDSVGLELGATLPQPVGAAFAQRPGVEVGLGIELPVAATATGPWLGLHGGVRWSDDVLRSGVIHAAADREAFLAITLAWHQVVTTHAVDMGDVPLR
jgi:hypothetical protein